MKTIQRSLLLSLVPLLAPVTASAETDKQTDVVMPSPVTKEGANSWRASQVMGLNVKNADDETIGEVEDLVLDMKSGKILAVVISSGGFLGMADTLSAVPVSVLRYDGAAKALKTKLTKDQLVKAPQFKADAWPNYNDEKTTHALRSYSNTIGGTDMESDRTLDRTTDRAIAKNKADREVTAPDNTAQNAKDTNRAETPTDQGNSEKDIQITKDIRSSIMDKELSFNAKNIKIITRNEYVSLKGVVESEAEHQEILKIARNHANTAKITDELKVDSK